MPGDTYFANVVSLLHMEGSNNGTTFTDVKGKAWTNAGNAVTSTTQKKFGTTSAYFDGNIDYISTPAHNDLEFGTSPFTIECWIYIAGNSPQAGGPGYRYATIVSELSSNVGGVAFSIAGSGTTTGTGLLWEDKSTGSSISGTWTVTVSQGAWHHVAMSRDGATIYLALDGTVYSTSVTGGVSRTIGSASYPMLVGRQNVSSFTYDFNGYIDELRITKGTARYTANYDVPTAAFSEYSRYISGTITETLNFTSWATRSYRADTGAFLGEVTGTSTYECPASTHAGPTYVSCTPTINGMWTANTVYALDTYIVPTNPVTTPYVYKCTTNGTSHAATEPTWGVIVGGTTADNDVVWTCLDRLPQPILHGPLIPTAS
jgi:hypothetical protein